MSALRTLRWLMLGSLEPGITTNTSVAFSSLTSEEWNRFLFHNEDIYQNQKSLSSGIFCTRIFPGTLFVNLLPILRISAACLSQTGKRIVSDHAIWVASLKTGTIFSRHLAQQIIALFLLLKFGCQLYGLASRVTSPPLPPDGKVRPGKIMAQ